MSDDYLWDGSGKPDPEVQRLESILRRFRHRQPAPKFLVQTGPFDRVRAWLSLPRLAAAAALAMVITATWLVLRQPKRVVEVAQKPGVARIEPAHEPKGAWEVARLEGTVKLGSSSLGDAAPLTLGEWLETGAASRVEINVDNIAEVEVESNTRLRRVETSQNQHRLALARGTIHARIWAPPGDFVVDTPSAVAVDLGCAYTLEVDDKGAGLVRVTFGWVGFQHDGRESFIPAGALCATRPGVGPGTPYFEDTSRKLRAALTQLDFETVSSPARAAALGTVLREARKRDAMTLWHLLARTNGAERVRVYDRLAALVPPPEEVSRQGALRLDKPLLDLWWNQLGLGDTTWWRMWEQTWAPPPK